MNCPGCGAAMQRAGNRPHFHCSACDLYHFSEETGDGVTVTGEPVGAACPVCRLPLRAGLIEDETVCCCDHCRGFLTPMDAFGRIVGKRRARHGSHEQRAEPFDPAELRRVLACPDCGGRMDAHPYSGGGNAVVDACEGCNLIWLDAGELAIIERYVPHVPKIEPVHTLPGASAPPAGGVLDVLFSGRRRGLLDDLFE